MERKKKIIWISVLIILLIIIFILLLIFNPFSKKPTETIIPAGNQNQNQTPLTGTVNTLPSPSPDRIKNEEDYPLGLESLASSYAERFGSYSSDANFKNLQDLKILSTTRMVNFIDSYVVTSTLGQDGYEAQEAKALNNQLIFLNDEKAVIMVSLQLNKYIGDQIDPTIDYSKVELTLIKNGTEWQVDEAIWK